MKVWFKAIDNAMRSADADCLPSCALTSPASVDVSYYLLVKSRIWAYNAVSTSPYI